MLRGLNRKQRQGGEDYDDRVNWKANKASAEEQKTIRMTASPPTGFASAFSSTPVILALVGPHSYIAAQSFAMQKIAQVSLHFLDTARAQRKLGIGAFTGARI